MSAQPLGPDALRRAWLEDERVGVAAPEPASPPVGSEELEERVEVLRRIDLWSALKMSLLVYFCLFVVWLTVGALVWALAREAGVLDNIGGVIEELGLADNGTFRFVGADWLRYSAILGPIGVVIGSLVTVAGVALFNGAARLSGGLEVTFRRR